MAATSIRRRRVRRRGGEGVAGQRRGDAGVRRRRRRGPDGHGDRGRGLRTGRSWPCARPGGGEPQASAASRSRTGSAPVGPWPGRDVPGPGRSGGSRSVDAPPGSRRCPVRASTMTAPTEYRSDCTVAGLARSPFWRQVARRTQDEPGHRHVVGQHIGVRPDVEALGDAEVGDLRVSVLSQRMLLGLMSRCSTPNRWAAARAVRVSARTSMTRCAGSGPRATISSRSVDPGSRSMTRYDDVSFSPKSSTATI